MDSFDNDGQVNNYNNDVASFTVCEGTCIPKHSIHKLCC